MPRAHIYGNEFAVVWVRAITCVTVVVDMELYAPKKVLPFPSLVFLKGYSMSAQNPGEDFAVFRLTLDWIKDNEASFTAVIHGTFHTVTMKDLRVIDGTTITFSDEQKCDEARGMGAKYVKVKSVLNEEYVQ